MGLKGSPYVSGYVLIAQRIAILLSLQALVKKQAEEVYHSLSWR